MSKFAVLHDRVLIKKNPPRKQTDSGIAIVDNFGYKGGPIEGIVVAVGPGTYTVNGDFVKADCEPGDQVIFAQTDLKEIKQLGDDFVIVPSSEILVRLRPENPDVPAMPDL